MFQVLLILKHVDNDTPSSIISRLRAHEDFEVTDLIAFGKASHETGSDDVTMVILDEICEICAERGSFPPKLPIGIMLQSAAQLAYKPIVNQSADHLDADMTHGYIAKLVRYATLLLQACEKSEGAVAELGPPSVFAWFCYTRSSYYRSLMM
ncbi:hypothetical protein PINS_up003721 [Pythium insidiosum]|nr:hypothetical protein PINS_up003721 [Pythium insidiosum]